MFYSGRTVNCGMKKMYQMNVESWLGDFRGNVESMNWLLLADFDKILHKKNELKKGLVNLHA